MAPKTALDWWELAEKIVPALPQYARENGCTFDMARFYDLKQSKDHKAAHYLLEALWWDLPDVGGIRYQPFHDLCDLCSEYPVCFPNYTPKGGDVG